MKFQIEGREYQIIETKPMTAASSESFVRRGFEGVFYFAKSEPTGRQRKVFEGLFLRGLKDGKFINAFA